MTNTLKTRESWLLACIELLKPDFIEVGATIPDKLRASCGWPSKSGLAKKKRRIGEAWSAKCSGDETFEIFISPVLKDGRPVLATLVHEIVHCAVGVEAGHKGPFKRIALAIGLEGKMTETVAGETLNKRIDEIIAQVGPYPHAELRSSNADEEADVPATQGDLQGMRLYLPHEPQGHRRSGLPDLRLRRRDGRGRGRRQGRRRRMTCQEALAVD